MTPAHAYLGGIFTPLYYIISCVEGKNMLDCTCTAKKKKKIKKYTHTHTDTDTLIIDCAI